MKSKHYLSALLTLITIVLHSQSTTSVITCQPFTWSVTGETYTESVQVTSGGQTLNLTIQENRTFAERIFACSSFTWDKTGSTYTTSGTYTHLETGDNGCNIEHQLVLTIGDTYNSSFGVAECDDFGWHELELPVGSEHAEAVSMDGSGTRIVLADGYADPLGRVVVYDWTSSGWVQAGNTLQGEAASHRFGTSVSLSTNGKYLAVGAPYASSNGNQGQVFVYKWTGAGWEQHGNPILAINEYDELGSSLDLNNDGSILAIGARSSARVAFELGEARVYQWVGDDWAQMGDHLYDQDFESEPDNLGESIALSGDGKSVIVGAPWAKNPNNRLTGGGKYLVYDWDGSAWNKRKEFNGYRAFMNVGRSVSISEDGQYIAGGGDGDRNKAGMVFTTKGALGELHSKVSGGYFGKSSVYNLSGETIAISSWHADGPEENTGMVQVFNWDGDNWEQMGDNIYGEAPFQLFGQSIAINSTGNILVAGSATLDTYPVNHTKIYYYGCQAPTQNCSPDPCTEPIEVFVEDTVCGFRNFAGNSITESGIYTSKFTTKYGCDSLVTLDLTVYPQYSSELHVYACDSYEFDGVVYTSSVNRWVGFLSQHGCDSAIFLRLKIGSVESYEIERTACESFEFDGNTLTTSGEYEATFPRTSGCDSLVNLTLTVVEPESVEVSREACNSFEFDGNSYTSSGEYTATFTNIHGCDSLVTLNLDIISQYNETLDVTKCNEYEFDGNTLTTSGIYSASYLTTEGCDSLVTLNLEIVDQFEETVNISSCESYVFDGNTITESGTYNGTFTSSMGCDSLVTLLLKINESQTVSKVTEGCGSYIFGLDTLTASGNYQKIFSDINGCDSLVNLSLTILNTNLCAPLSAIDEEIKVIVSPNPTKGLVRVIGVNKDEEYVLLDLSGKVVQKGNLNDADMHIQSNEGVYMLVFPSKNMMIRVIKTN